MIRHYEFYPKRMIRHYVTHRTNCCLSDVMIFWVLFCRKAEHHINIIGKFQAMSALEVIVGRNGTTPDFFFFCSKKVTYTFIFVQKHNFH